MAEIRLTIPDDQVSRVVDAMATYYGWTPETGLTKVQFAKRSLAQHVRAVVVRVERDAAEAAMTDPAAPDVT